MGRLKSALMSKYQERDQNIHIFTPRNTETVQLYFRGEKLARVSGRDHYFVDFTLSSALCLIVDIDASTTITL